MFGGSSPLNTIFYIFWYKKHKMDNDLKSQVLAALEKTVEQAGGKKFHAGYVFNFIHEKNVETIDAITTLSKPIRQRLIDDGYVIDNLKLVETFTDEDGTSKYIFETFDGYHLETVLLNDDGRNTLCISSQVGCRMNCTFCATAKVGFKRSLTAGEIVDQVYKVWPLAGKISNVVYMGMGEPFDNFENVIKSALILNHEKGKNIGARHITISTCGITDRILEFARLGFQFRLAISLHSADEQTRETIMPVSRKWPLKDIICSLKGYTRMTGRRVTFEYCMIEGINDRGPDADALAKLIKPIKCNLNLIEYNEHPGCGFKASSQETIKDFQRMMTERGFEAHTRFKRGVNINAACGQLGLLGG